MPEIDGTRDSNQSTFRVFFYCTQSVSYYFNHQALKNSGLCKQSVDFEHILKRCTMRPVDLPVPPNLNKHCLQCSDQSEWEETNQSTHLKWQDMRNGRKKMPQKVHYKGEGIWSQYGISHDHERDTLSTGQVSTTAWASLFSCKQNGCSGLMCVRSGLSKYYYY